MPTEWPATKIYTRKIADLTVLETNSRVHSDEQIDTLIGLIKKFGWTNPILIDENNMILAGHGRALAAEKMGLEEVPAVIAKGWTEEQKRAYAIADNRIYELGGWDEEIVASEYEFLDGSEYDMADLDLGYTEPEPLENEEPAELKVSLADKFGVVPFTILSAREGWWQNRKRAWMAIGIKSEVGRGDNLLKFSDSIQLDGDAYKEKFSKKKAGPAKAYNTTDWIKKNGLSGGAQDVANGSGTSVFDPVLCELSYSWFCPKGGRILDPFAGGSVRGVVAGVMGREYTGIDLSQDQIDANEAQREDIGSRHDMAAVNWHVGDSAKMDDFLPDEAKDFDFLFSCPPYADLEVYSDADDDISNMPYDEFLVAYYKIIAAAVARLKDDTFACFVTGDARGKDGNYYGLPEDTVKAFEAAGMRKYNEAILVTATGSLAIRINKQFSASRKLGKTHQNVTVFIKGDAKKATAKLEDPDFGDIETEEEKYGEQL